MKKKKIKTPDTVNELMAKYRTDKANESTFKIFNSFQEQENDNYKWLASLTPVEHLQNATALIKRIFADSLKQNPTLGTNLTID